VPYVQRDKSYAVDLAYQDRDRTRITKARSASTTSRSFFWNCGRSEGVRRGQRERGGWVAGSSSIAFVGSRGLTFREYLFFNCFTADWKTVALFVL